MCIYIYIYICVCVCVCVCVCACVYSCVDIYIYIKEKPLKITHIFCDDIYFSRPHAFKMLDLHLQTKK